MPAQATQVPVTSTLGLPPRVRLAVQLWHLRKLYKSAPWSPTNALQLQTESGRRGSRKEWEATTVSFKLKLQLGFSAQASKGAAAIATAWKAGKN